MTLEEQRGKKCALLLIRNDCETLKAIFHNKSDSIFTMCIIPYLALFCRSYQEFLKIDLLDPVIDSQIYDLRNSIKYYADRYGKSKQRFLKSDEMQNNEYRDLLRFRLLKKLNIH